MSSVLLCLTNGSLIASAWFVMDLGFRDASRWFRAVATGLLFMFSALALSLLLGSVGQFTRGGQTAACLLTVSLCAAAWFYERRTSSQRSPVVAPCGTANHRLNSGWLAVLFVTALLVPHFAFLKMPLRQYDDFTYQGPATYEFIINGSLQYAQPLQLQKWYPMNAELLTAWFFLPTRTDAYWCLVGLLWAVLGALLLFGLSGFFSRNRWSGLAVAGAFVACSAVTKEMRTNTATDLAVAASMLGVFAALRPASGSSLSKRYLALAGAAGGAMLGMKISYAIVLLPVAVYVLWVVRPHAARQRAYYLASFALPVVLFGSFWYLRNWVVTGNPFYPAEVGPFYGPLDAESQSRTKLAYWLFGPAASLHWWRVAGSQLLDSVGPLLVFSLAGLVIKTGRMIRSRSVEGGKMSDGEVFALLLLLCAWLLWLSFPLMPFSGTTNSSAATVKIRPRFIIGALSLGLAFFAEQGRIAAGLLAVAAILSNLYATRWEYSLWGLLAAGLLYLSATISAKARLPTRHAMAGALALLLVVLAGAESWFRSEVNRNVFRRKLFGMPLGQIWQRVDSLPSGQRIAVMGNSYWQALGIYGRHLQHRLVGVFPDGRAFPLDLHTEWNERRKGLRWWDDWEPKASAFRVANLQAAGINYVVLQRAKDSPWPKQRATLRRDDSARRVLGKNRYELWKIDRDRHTIDSSDI